MPDRFGPRGVMALMIPLQNANMQPEYEMMRPPGISNQTYRIDLSVHDRIPEATYEVIASTLLCWPDIVVVGNSIEMRDWSLDQHEHHRERLQAEIGNVPLVLAGDATVAALKAVGARRITVLSPMHARYSASVARFYTAMGFDVVNARHLDVARSEDIIKVSEARIRDAFAAMAGDDADTLLHVGGALPVVPLIEELEATHGKPVVSVNAATYWYALRRLGVDDVIAGFGRLLRLPGPGGTAPAA